MPTLSYNKILPKSIIVFNGEPCEVLSAHVFRKQQRKPVNQTKLRSLKTGKMIEQTFHQKETAEEAEVTQKDIEFIYESKGENWFCIPGTPSERFKVENFALGSGARFIPSKMIVTALLFDEEIIYVKIPIKVELKVKEADPAVRGNTSSNATKEVVLETGAKIMVPMFINKGDTIRVNTETESYAERVEKG